MARRMGAGTIRLERASAIAAVAAVGSRLEQEGPLGAEFDRTVEDSSFGEKSWEKAETKMQQLAMELALQKGRTAPEQVDVVLGGDLLNQCIASAYAVRALGRPFLGLYGACSTMAESLTLAALLVEGGAAPSTNTSAKSSNAASERKVSVLLSPFFHRASLPCMMLGGTFSVTVFSAVSSVLPLASAKYLSQAVQCQHSTRPLAAAVAAIASSFSREAWRVGSVLPYLAPHRMQLARWVQLGVPP